MKMNLPNKLTLLRLLLIPFFVIFYDMAYVNQILIHNIFLYISGIIFIAASITDFLDGYIARKYNLVTNFGKLMDPLADKTLVCVALICLSFNNIIPLWTVLIIIFREFLISGFRLIAVEKNVVIQASIYGKYKTATQMVAIILYLFNVCKFSFYICIFNDILYYVSVALSVISLFDYIVKNKQVLLEDNN